MNGSTAVMVVVPADKTVTCPALPAVVPTVAMVGLDELQITSDV